MKVKIKSKHYLAYIIIFGLFFVTTYAIITMILSQSLEAITIESEEYMNDSLNQRMANIESSIKDEWRYLETFSDSLVLYDDYKENYVEIYNKLLNAKTYYSLENMSLISKDKQVISTRKWNENEIENSKLINRAYMGNREITFDENSNMYLSIPIYKDKSIVSVLVLENSKDNILDDFRLSPEYTNDYYALVDNRGNVFLENKNISSGDISNVFREIGASQKEILQIFTSINNKMSRKINLESKNGDISSVHIRPVENSRWILITLHKCSVISTLSSKMRMEIIIIVSIIIILSIIVVMIFNMIKNSVIHNLEFDNRSLSDEQNELKKISEKDPFTDVYNKKTIMEKINSEIENNNMQKSAFYMIDLDKFKVINDTYGHIVGDQVLVEFAKCLKKSSNSEDLIGRIGGDEFVVFKVGCLSEKEVIKYASNLREHIKNIKIDDYDFKVSATIGIARYPVNGNDFQDLLLSADKAMYELKDSNKRGNFKIYIKK